MRASHVSDQESAGGITFPLLYCAADTNDKNTKLTFRSRIDEPATVLELMINGDVWKKLPQDLQEIIKSATMDATLRSQIVSNKANAEALVELREKHGVHIERTPPDILTRILETWDQIAKEESAKNSFFKKVYDAQRDFASRVVPARRSVYAPYDLGANYYWPEKK